MSSIFRISVKRVLVGSLIASLAALGVPTPSLGSTELSYTLATADIEVRNSGSVISDTNGAIEVQLTPMLQSQKGGFFAKQALNLTHSFVLNGEIYLGSETANQTGGFDARGADGVAFTLFSQIPASLAGADGDGLGYSSVGTAFAVEWDTYDNSTKGDLGTEGDDLSMALAKNTANHTVAGALYAPVQLVPRSTMIADNGTWRKFQINWYGPSEQISVSYDLDSDGSYGAGETIFESVDVNLTGSGGLFEGVGNQAYWGFTGSTGTYVNQQRVRFATSALTVIVPPPPPYVGPLLTSAEPNPVAVGETLTVAGSRLSSITKVSIDGVPATDVVARESELSFKIPEVTAGLKSVVVESDFGTLTVQDLVRVTDSPSAQTTSKAVSSIRRIGDTARVMVSGVVEAGKVQIMFNGREIAWVNATSAADPKLRSANGAAYLVRTIELVAGQKNVIEIHVDGERLRRVAYTG